MDVAAAAVLRQRPVADEVVLPPTPDQLIVLVTRGKAMIESSDGGRWRRAAYVPGQIGLTVPGCSTRLRWRSTSDAVLTTPHVSLPGPSARARRSGAAGSRRELVQPARCAVDPAVTHSGFSRASRKISAVMFPTGRRPAGLAVHAPDGPATADDVAVPAQDRLRSDLQLEPLGAALSASRRTGSRAVPGSPVQVQARLPPSQYRELVAQDHEPCGLPRLLTLRQPQP